MAIAAPTIWEMRTSGSNNNGGGCVWTSLVNSTYKWTLSASGTSEYYVELAGGGDPSLTEAINVQLDGKFNIATNGTVGSLNANEWDWGDNDTLGYSTVYVRLSDSVDPDTKALGFVGMVKGGGADYSQQDSDQLNHSDGATSGIGVTTYTSAAGSFTAAMKGNLINLTAGTNLTAGWYEITVFTDGNTVTLDRAPDDGVGGVSGATGYVGGARAVQTDVFYEQCVAGNIIYFKNTGTYTLTENLNIAKAGTAVSPITTEGYNTTRGDNPTGANRPLIAAGAYYVILGNYWNIRNFRGTGTPLYIYRLNAGSIAVNCDVNNSSGSANREAIRADNDGVRIINNELQSLNGSAIEAADSALRASGNYLHDSSSGIEITGQGYASLSFNVIDTCTTGIGLASFNYNTLENNTIHNVTTGISANSAHSNTIKNNIIDSCITGASWTTEQANNFFDHNDWYNNTTDVSNVTKGDNALALDPQFGDAANADFSIGTNLKAGGFPGIFQGAHANSVGYLDVGAVQREEPAGGGGLIVHPGMDGGMNA